MRTVGKRRVTERKEVALRTFCAKFAVGLDKHTIACAYGQWLQNKKVVYANFHTGDKLMVHFPGTYSSSENNEISICIKEFTAVVSHCLRKWVDGQTIFRHSALPTTYRVLVSFLFCLYTRNDTRGTQTKVLCLNTATLWDSTKESRWYYEQKTWELKHSWTKRVNIFTTHV